MKTIIRHAAFGARMRICPRRCLASKWMMLANLGAAGPRAWGRSPIAFVWRRRRRERAISMVRLLAASKGALPQRERITERRTENWLTLTRLFERYVSFGRPQDALTQPVAETRVHEHGRIQGVAAAPGVVRHLTTRQRMEQVSTSGTRVSAATGRAVADPMPRIAAAATLSIRQSTDGDAGSHIAPRHSRRADVQGPILQRRSVAALQTPRLLTRRRAITVSVVGPSSARLHRIVAAPIAHRHIALNALPPAIPAAVAMTANASPHLIFRVTRSAAEAAHPADHAIPSAATAVTAGFRSENAASTAPPPSMRAATESARSTALPLSGPAIDRLAEDVMYRIERRIRIERERRGL